MRSLLTMALELLHGLMACDDVWLLLVILPMSFVLTRVELSTSSNTLHNRISSS